MPRGKRIKPEHAVSVLSTDVCFHVKSINYSKKQLQVEVRRLGLLCDIYRRGLVKEIKVKHIFAAQRNHLTLKTHVFLTNCWADGT